VPLGVVALALFALPGTAGATPTRADGGIPACPAGTNVFTLPGCVVASWMEPTSYGSRITATLRGSFTRKWVKASPATGYAHWVYAATVLIHDPLALCPNPTPLSSIPCQNGGPGVSLRAFQRAKGKLAPVPAGFSAEPATCNAQGTACALSFVIFPEIVYGTVEMLFSVGVQQLTKNPAGDLGQAGAQFPVSIDVAKVAKPK
jgi:hypothetical protein